MAQLRIALAQIDTCVGDLEANTRAVVEWARRAADAGADLVVFPEMTVTGYPIEDLALRASFRRGAEAALVRTAGELVAAGLGDLAVLVGTVGEKTSQEHAGAPARPTNQAVLLQHGVVQARYDKHHLPNYGVFDEFRIFTPGDTACVLDVRGRRVGVVICEDIWQDGGPVAQLAADGVDLLVVLNGSPFEEGKGHLRTELAARRAREVGAPLAYVNMVGGQDDKQLVKPTEVFDGNSWSDAAEMPTPREHLAAVSDGVYVYAIGGRNLSADENSAAFERFNPASGTWDRLTDMPTARGSYGAAFLDGRIVAVGGEEPTRVLSTVEMYDIASGKWTTVAPINTPVHGEVVAAVGSTIYCIGGADRPTHESAVATVEALDFT